LVGLNVQVPFWQFVPLPEELKLIDNILRAYGVQKLQLRQWRLAAADSLHRLDCLLKRNGRRVLLPLSPTTSGKLVPVVNIKMELGTDLQVSQREVVLEESTISHRLVQFNDFCLEVQTCHIVKHEVHFTVDEQVHNQIVKQVSL
jgi:hypothetical protein